LPQVGDKAPEFELLDQDGNTVKLSDFAGKTVVLYFYPKADTPGCTTQACSIRDEWSEFERAGAVVLGVSPDSEESHAKFRQKYGLPFTLLADPDHQLTEQYGFWVARVFRRVKPEEHVQQVLTALV